MFGSPTHNGMVRERRLPLAGLTVAAGIAAVTALIRPVTGAAKEVRRSMAAGDPFDDRPTPNRYDSPQFHDGSFHNRLPSKMLESSGRGSMAIEFARKGNSGRPSAPVPLATPELPEQAAEVAATWLGHATFLIELKGHWVLVDPVWSERVSPSAVLGPRRSHPVPLELGDLPELSAVLISHDHYDHLDTATVDALVAQQSMPFVVPLGIGEHLRRWGVPEDRIVELDWDTSHIVTRPGVPDLTLVCTEARHFSGRGFVQNSTLWSSWSLIAGAGRKRRAVFFGGDTGYTPAFADIGRKHGPFDLTVLPIGAYDERWSDIHMNPAEAVQAHQDLRGDILLPGHWATFDLAFHTWSAPVKWLVAEAAERDVRIATPRPGERFTAEGVLPSTAWWTLQTH
jgi:L-ascorbate metabolism protein UlaG (beta-lactamase superfamily)